MSNENKLAWKGSPAPWTNFKYKTSSKSWGIFDADGQPLAEIKPFGRKEQIEANAHMASAAPEAIEFIADLLDAIDKEMFIVPQELTEVIKRSEAILKKAYNF